MSASALRDHAEASRRVAVVRRVVRALVDADAADNRVAGEGPLQDLHTKHRETEHFHPQICTSRRCNESETINHTHENVEIAPKMLPKQLYVPPLQCVKKHRKMQSKKWTLQPKCTPLK